MGMKYSSVIAFFLFAALLHDFVMAARGKGITSGL